MTVRWLVVESERVRVTVWPPDLPGGDGAPRMPPRQKPRLLVFESASGRRCCPLGAAAGLRELSPEELWQRFRAAVRLPI